MTYQPPKQPQYVPKTATSSKDCMAALTALLIARATLGRIKPTHADIRALSGAPPTRGLFVSECVKAAAHYGVKLTSAYDQTRDTLRATVQNGAAVGVIVTVPPWVIFPTSTYRGPHGVYLNAWSEWPGGEPCACELRSSTRHGEFTLDDPGTTTAGFIQRSEGWVFRSCEAINDGIHMLVARDTEGVEMTIAGTPYCWTEPSTASTKTRRLKTGQEVYVKRTLNSNGEAWAQLGKGDYVRGIWLR